MITPKYVFTIEQTFSMTHTLTEFIHPALIRFKEIISSLDPEAATPDSIFIAHPDKTDEDVKEIWLGMVDEMIFSFSKNPEDYTENEQDRRDKGKLTFVEHFNDLWW